MIRYLARTLRIYLCVCVCVLAGKTREPIKRKLM